MSAAAASVASLVAPPSMLLQSPRGADPIFELIEAHRRAFRASETAIGKKSRAEQRFEDETGYFKPSVRCDSALCLSPGRSPGTPDRRATSHEEVDALLKSDPVQAASAHAELDQLTARYNKLVGPHEAAEDFFVSAYGEATENLLGCAPTSLAGLLALMRYMRATDSKGHEVFSEDDDFSSLLLSIEQSVCALAGMKKPQPAEVA